MQALIDWLKQPPTIKGLVILAGILGFKLEPDKVQEITLLASGLYAALAMFYDNGTRKPRIPTPEELNQLLTSDAIIALVNLRRAKIDAEKALGSKAP